MVKMTDDTGRTPCEDKDRDWSAVPISQGAPRIARNHQKLGDG